MAATHLGFPEGSLRRGSPVPLCQLMEETRSPRGSVAPHHLLSSKIYSRLKSSNQIQAEPAALHFHGFDLGKDYQKVLKLINVSSEVVNVHILPTQTKYFQTTYTKKYRLIPGLAYTVKVHFRPDEWRYFYDSVRIHCKGEESLLIPVHAYPVIDDLRIPTHVHLPGVPLGHSVSHSIPLRCSCPVAFEFQVHVVQAHPAFQVDPLGGSIPANGEAAITVTFRPLQYGTSQLTLQLVVSQFNTKPFLCTLTGSSAPHLPTSTLEQERAGPGVLADGKRTPALLVPAVLKIKRTSSKRAEKPQACGSKTTGQTPSSPATATADVCTPAGVAKMLIKDSDKLCSRDLRDATSCERLGGLNSRQVKEAFFLKKVQRSVKEERANRLRWQQHLGQSPVSEQSRKQIYEEREVAAHEYMTKRDDGQHEEDAFVSGPPALSTRRVLRDARQAAVGAPCFQFYTGPQVLMRLRAVRLFQQAARKVVVRCRMNRRLACLRKMAAGLKDPSHHNREQVKGNKKMEALMVSPDKILPFSFPVCVNTADQLTLGDLPTMAAAPVDIAVATHVPLFQLQVPQHYKVMGYAPPSAWDAFNSHVAPGLARPLRCGALDELLPEVSPQEREGEVGGEEPGETVETEESQEVRGAEALFQMAPANPLRIFNPAPGLQTYKPTPKYLETAADYHLCPLPRFTANRSQKLTTQKNFLDRKEVIKGVMTWKSSDWTILRRLSQLPPPSPAARRTALGSSDLKTDMIPERAPPPLTGPSEDMISALLDIHAEEPAVCLTPDIIRAEFLADEEVP